MYFELYIYDLRQLVASEITVASIVRVPGVHKLLIKNCYGHITYSFLFLLLMCHKSDLDDLNMFSLDNNYLTYIMAMSL